MHRVSKPCSPASPGTGDEQGQGLAGAGAADRVSASSPPAAQGRAPTPQDPKLPYFALAYYSALQYLYETASPKRWDGTEPGREGTPMASTAPRGGRPRWGCAHKPGICGQAPAASAGTGAPQQQGEHLQAALFKGEIKYFYETILQPARGLCPPFASFHHISSLI